MDHNNFYRSPTRCSPFLPYIIAGLLLIEGVGLNSGPTVMEVLKKLDEFISTFLVTRDQFLLLVPALSARLAKFVLELKTLVNNMRDKIAQQETCLHALEQSIDKTKPYDGI